MHSQNFLLFAIALSIAVATPGPGMLAVTSCAMGRGFRDAIALTVGIVIGDLIFFLLAAFGMAALAHSMGELFLIVKLLGAAYLIWLGVKLWRASDAAPAKTLPTGRRGLGRTTVAGAALTLGNPKTIAFYAGLLPTFIDLGKLTAVDVVIMMALMVPIIVGIASAYAFAALRARHYLGDPRRARFMNRAAGTMMIGAGIAIATE